MATFKNLRVLLPRDFFLGGVFKQELFKTYYCVAFDLCFDLSRPGYQLFSKHCAPKPVVFSRTEYGLASLPSIPDTLVNSGNPTVEALKDPAKGLQSRFSVPRHGSPPTKARRKRFTPWSSGLQPRLPRRPKRQYRTL